MVVVDDAASVANCVPTMATSTRTDVPQDTASTINASSPTQSDAMHEEINYVLPIIQSKSRNQDLPAPGASGDLEPDHRGPRFIPQDDSSNNGTSVEYVQLHSHVRAPLGLRPRLINHVQQCGSGSMSWGRSLADLAWRSRETVLGNGRHQKASPLCTCSGVRSWKYQGRMDTENLSD